MGGLNFESLSARRAWIEITVPINLSDIPAVALRKESVDRNTSIDNLTQGVFESLSARRAWIEIDGTRTAACGWMSLSARRAWIEILKQLLLKTLKASLSARRAWIEMENSGTQADPAKCRSPQGERG